MTVYNASVTPYEIVFTTLNAVSVLVCLLAAILVFYLKLYQMVVYRLALYQVLSSLCLALVEVLQIIFVNYYSNPVVYGRVCTAFGWLFTYAQWMKLLFTVWVTLHLFGFGVLRKKLNRLEALYVATSILTPALIAVVPLATHTYGLSPTGPCYIVVPNDSNHVAAIERFALWDGPAMAILLAASAAMVVLVIKLARIVCRRSRYQPLDDGDQYWKALKQLLPLAAFPIVFFFFEVPVFVFHIYLAETATPNAAITFAVFVFLPLWSVASGVTLMIHVIVAKCLPKKRRGLLSDQTTCNGSNVSSVSSA